MANQDEPDEVGYCKPPKDTRFTKGKSGNPKGRPKGAKNLATIVTQDAKQKVRVNGQEGSRMITKLEAAVMQLGNKAAQGHLPSQREMFALVRLAEEAAKSGVAAISPQESDKKVMENLIRRIQTMGAEAPITEAESETEESQ